MWRAGLYGCTVARMKRCGRCKETLPRDSFNAHARSKDGLQAFCKPCHRRAVSECVRKKKYGLTIDEVYAYECVPCCQACGKFFAASHCQQFDHCHTHGHMRGVLCHACNMAISGSADEALMRMDACREYLLRDEERRSEQARAG